MDKSAGTGQGAVMANEAESQAVTAPEGREVHHPYELGAEALMTLTLLWEGKRLTLPWQNLEEIMWHNPTRTLTGKFGKKRFVAKIGRAQKGAYNVTNFEELYTALEGCMVQRLYHRPAEGFTLSVEEEVPGGEGEPPSWEKL